ncbi:MAG: TRAP transporter small permease [Deltaproteobacteria bacterium]|nr:TRAP transporter small permease [Deltaproteobacteria bacterium]
MKKSSRWLTLIRRLDSFFSFIGGILGVSITTLIILTLSAGVISRYIFNRPFFWTDEFARILLIWSILVGAALGFRKGSATDHIRMDFFVTLFPDKFRKITDRIVLGVNIFFCVAILIIGVRFFLQTISFRTAAMDISKGYVYISLPIFAVMALVFLVNLFTEK